jgi:redox-sensitive bicupin YhaK (pirin superfamily)
VFPRIAGLSLAREYSTVGAVPRRSTPTDITQESAMIDREILAAEVKSDRFPFPNQGDITLAVRSANYSIGPVMLHLVMQAGSVIPAHIHEGVSEVLYVVEGDFINEGKQYTAGTSLHVKAGNLHGPHSTKNGCKLLVLWTEPTTHQEANLGDFVLPAVAAA